MNNEEVRIAAELLLKMKNSNAKYDYKVASRKRKIRYGYHLKHCDGGEKKFNVLKNQDMDPRVIQKKEDVMPIKWKVMYY